MEYSWLQITWLFFIYSLAGWIAEVCHATIHKRKFINRGFVNGPLCPIYGMASVLFTLFLPELTGNLFFLYLGGIILATVLEYATGLLMHKIFRQKLWDYSAHRWNLDGYVCAGYSLLWGALAVVLMRFVNPLLCSLIDLIPTLISRIILLILNILLLLDFVTVSLTVLGMQKEAARFAQLSSGLQKTSGILQNALTKKIQSRMMKSFPALSLDTLVRHKTKEAQNTASGHVFAAGCGYYKLASLFFIGAFLGDITETIFCLITAGELMSRSSVVYGPFSIVWGLGCALLTALLYRYKDKGIGFIFLTGTLLGGAYEYICSVFTEIMFGTVFWDYSGFQFNLGGRINLLYCFFWGFAAIAWLRGIYPFLACMIEKIPVKIGKFLCNTMTIFMIFNIIVSGLALARYTRRNSPDSDAVVAVGSMDTSLPADTGQTPQWISRINALLDKHFDDERMARIYPNAKIIVDGVPTYIH